jgi:predicted permease
MPQRSVVHRWLWLEQSVHDLRYAWRGLLNSRAFLSTTVLTLGIGLGLVTVVFAIFNAYVLRPFAVRDPYALHVIGWEAKNAQGWRFSWREFSELGARSDLFQAVSAERTRDVISGGRQLNVGFVSGNYFEMLGAHVSRGRALADFDMQRDGAAAVAVLSDQGWAGLFDRDPRVIGRTLDLNDQRFVIVGVMRPEFAGLDDSPRDAWVPVTMYPAVTKVDLFRGSQPRELVLTGRLRNGVTALQAEGALAQYMTHVSGRRDAVHASVMLRATPAPLSVELLAVLSPVFAAFALVLVAACANVSNVMLARATARHREIGVRLSLGATRGRIVRQLVVEGAMIAALAGVLGLGVAALALRAGLKLFVAALPPSVASLIRVVPLDFDYRVFLFALAASAAATLMFALLPALQATHVSLTNALRGQAVAALRASTLRNLLVSGQVTVSLVILIAAATLVRNAMVLGHTNLGLRTDGVISIQQDAREATLIPRVARVLAADPRVAAVAVTNVNPLFEENRQTLVTPAGAAGSLATRYTFVSPEYFPILGIPIERGRGFRPDEAAAESRVGIVSAATARAFWPGADPIGQTLRIEHPSTDTEDKLPGYSQVLIVGVAKDVVSGFVFDGEDRAHLYLPTSATGAHAAALLVRGVDPVPFRREALPALLLRVQPDPFAFQALPLTEVLALQMFPLQAASWIGALLSAIAIVLSASGLYGVLTFMLSQRTREIGIRMALGATSARVVALVMRQCARLAALGVSLGIALAFVVMKVLSSVIVMRNVSVVEPRAFAAGVGLVALAATAASYLPAKRATRIEPALALRADG